MIPATQQRRALGLLLSLALVVSVAGVAWPVWRHGGGAISERATEQRLIALHDDQAAADLMARELYAEPVEAREPRSADGAIIDAGIESVYAAERIGAGLMLACALLIPLVSGRKPVVGAVMAVFVAAGLLVEARCAALNGGKAFSELAVAAHAARWGMPMVLALLLLARPAADRILKTLAACACALTFATHGWEAWHLNPPFVDQLSLSLHHAGVTASDAWVRGCLKVIGVMDGLLAAALLIRRWPVVPAWMALWGLATAVGRIWAFGPDQWQEAAMRSANFALPMFVLGCLIFARQTPPAQPLDASLSPS